MSQEKPKSLVREDKVKLSDNASKKSKDLYAENIVEENIELVDQVALDVEEDIKSEEISENKIDEDPKTKIIEKLKNDLQKRDEEVASLRLEFTKLQAETENYKKRMLKEKNEFAQFANEKLIKELIPIYENLDRALNANETTADNLKTGVEMIFKSFTSFLEKEKIKPIPSLGEKFDPKIHEALSQIESANEEENTVLQEFSKGFFLNDRVLRPAKVVISKKLVNSKEEESLSEKEEKDS